MWHLINCFLFWTSVALHVKSYIGLEILCGSFPCYPSLSQSVCLLSVSHVLPGLDVLYGPLLCCPSEFKCLFVLSSLGSGCVNMNIFYLYMPKSGLGPVRFLIPALEDHHLFIQSLGSKNPLKFQAEVHQNMQLSVARIYCLQKMLKE